MPNGPGGQAVLFFILYSVAISLSYLGGIDSSFTLDDAPNLEGLEAVKNGSTGIIDFAFESSGSPSGRPLSMLSFALQAASWPDHPSHFKLVNVVIHIVSGLFVFLISRRLSQLLGAGVTAATMIAALTALWWGLLPIHVSSILYVIQRMNLLSSFFLLGTVWLYLSYRIKLSSSSSPIQLLLLGAIVGAGLILSVFSKGNGIILPALLFIIEIYFFKRADMPSWWPGYRALVLLGPLVVFILYLILRREALLETYATRDFGPGERLMTQARVIWMYLQSILIPVPSQYGVIHDDILVSRSLTQPISTLFSIAALLFTAIAAFLFRKRFVVGSFAVFWFCVSHLVESTAIPLELYFEHRNYVASMGIIFALSFSLWRWTKGSGAAHKKAIIALGVGVVGLFSLVTQEVVQLWARPFEQAAITFQAHPNSPRANIQWITQLIERQRIPEAYKQAALANLQWPQAGNFYLIRAMLACDRKVTAPVEDSIRADAVAELRFSNWDTTYVTQLLGLVTSNNCQYINDTNDLDAFLVALANNPSWQKSHSTVLVEVGRYFHAQQQVAAAHRFWQRAYDLNGDLGIVFLQATSFYRQGDLEAARNKVMEIQDAIDSGQVTDQAKIGAFQRLKQRLDEALEAN